MNHKRLKPQVIGLLLVLLVLTACGTFQPTSTPTATPALTATSPLVATESVADWDYVALGDSRTAWALWPKSYADYIETDLGIRVKLRNEAVGGQSSDELLSRLRDNEQFRELISESEVVTVFTDGETGYYALTRPSLPCDSAIETFERNLDDIIAEILSLRGSNSTIIRVVEYYHFNVKEQKEHDIFEDKKACFEAYNDRIHQVASKYDIPVVPVYLGFNGPNGDEDPDDKGYLKDGVHTSPAGDVVIANLLRELGYDPIVP